MTSADAPSIDRRAVRALAVGISLLAVAVGLTAGPFSRSAHAETDPNSYDLSVRVTADATRAAPGDRVSVTVTWTNRGPASTGGYRLTYSAPADTTIVAGSSGWTSTGASASRTVLTALAAGETRSDELLLEVDPGASAGRSTGTLSVRDLGIGTPAAGDNTPGNDTATHPLTVVASTPTPTPSSTRSTGAATPGPTRSPSTGSGSSTTRPARPTSTVAALPVAATPRPSGSAQAGPTGWQLNSVSWPTPTTAGPSTASPSTAGAVVAASPPSATVTVTDSAGTGAQRVLPLVGAAACFAGAGVGWVLLRRRLNAAGAQDSATLYPW